MFDEMQREHRVISILGFGPAADERVQCVLVPEPRGEILEADVVRPFPVSRDPGHRAPLRFGEARDGEPAIFPGARVDVVRCRRLVRGAVAIA